MHLFVFLLCVHVHVDLYVYLHPSRFCAFVSLGASLFLYLSIPLSISIQQYFSDCSFLHFWTSSSTSRSLSPSRSLPFFFSFSRQQDPNTCLFIFILVLVFIPSLLLVCLFFSTRTPAFAPGVCVSLVFFVFSLSLCHFTSVFCWPCFASFVSFVCFTFAGLVSSCSLSGALQCVQS